MSAPKSVYLLAALLAATACGGPRKARVIAPGAPTVALLPFTNESVDLRAPGLAREETAKQLTARGYAVLERGDVDEALRKLGVTEGGQLAGLDAERLKAGLPADLYVFGEVTEYGVQSAIALTRRAVSLTLRLAGPDGATRFQGAGSGQATTVGADAAGELALHLAGKVVRSIKESNSSGRATAPVKQAAAAADVVTDADLKDQTRAAVRQALEKLPKLP